MDGIVVRAMRYPGFAFFPGGETLVGVDGAEGDFARTRRGYALLPPPPPPPLAAAGDAVVLAVRVIDDDGDGDIAAAVVGVIAPPPLVRALGRFCGVQ